MLGYKDRPNAGESPTPKLRYKRDAGESPHMANDTPGLIDNDSAEPSPRAPLGESATPSEGGPVIEQATKTHRMKLEEEVLYDQLTVSKYSSIRAVFREFMTNGIATCLRARKHLGDSYSPTVHIAYYPGEQQVVIVDNGMGISRDELDDMLHPGRSPNRHNPKQPGKYGIGRLSAAVATGADGGYNMESRSRRTDETIKGVWRGLDFGEYDDMESRLGEDQYGTRFQIPLKEDVDVQRHIDRIAPYARIPVLYTEHNADGTEAFTEEYGGTRYTMDNDPTRSVVFENEYLRLVVGERNSLGADAINERVVVLDAPVDSEIDLSFRFRYDSWALLLKEESERIVAGPNRGLIRVSNTEYERMDADERDQYIPERECSSEDIYLPTPVGDRDRLHENPEFEDWLQKRALEAYAQKLKHASDTFYAAPEVTPELFMDDDLAFFGYMVDARHKYRESKHVPNHKYGSYYIEARGADEPDERVEKFKDLIFTSVDYCPPGTDPNRKRSWEKVGIWRIFHECGPYADVFMAIKAHQKKVRVIREDSRDHVLVHIPRARYYEKYAEYGFRKLKNIDEHLDEFDCSQELKDALLTDDSTSAYENPNSGKDAPDRQLTVYWNYYSTASRGDDWERKQATFIASDLRDALESDANTMLTADAPDDPENEHDWEAKAPDGLVLFPPSTDRNLTDHLPMLPADETAVANCAQMTADYLSDLPGVRLVDDVFADAQSVPLTTPEGTFSFADLRDHDEYEVYLFHIISEVAADTFRAHHLPVIDMAKKRLIKKLTKKRSYGIQQHFGDGPEHPEVAYVPVLESELRQLYPLLDQLDTNRVGTFRDEGRLDLPVGYNKPTSTCRKTYAEYRLQPWEDTGIFNRYVEHGRGPGLASGGYELIEMLASFADQGYEPTLDSLPFDPFDPNDVENQEVGQ